MQRRNEVRKENNTQLMAKNRAEKQLAAKKKQKAIQNFNMYKHRAEETIRVQKALEAKDQVELAEFVLRFYESNPGGKTMAVKDFGITIKQYLGVSIAIIYRYLPTIYDFILSQQDDPKLFDIETMTNMRLKIEDGFIVGLAAKIDLTESGITSRFKSIRK